MIGQMAWVMLTYGQPPVYCHVNVVCVWTIERNGKQPITWPLEIYPIFRYRIYSGIIFIVFDGFDNIGRIHGFSNPFSLWIFGIRASFFGALVMFQHFNIITRISRVISTKRWFYLWKVIEWTLRKLYIKLYLCVFISHSSHAHLSKSCQLLV